MTYDNDTESDDDDSGTTDDQSIVTDDLLDQLGESLPELEMQQLNYNVLIQKYKFQNEAWQQPWYMKRFGGMEHFDLSIISSKSWLDASNPKRYYQKEPTFYSPGLFTRIYKEDFQTLGHRLWNMFAQLYLLVPHLLSEKGPLADMPYKQELMAQLKTKESYQSCVASVAVGLSLFMYAGDISHFACRLFITSTLACLGDIIGLTTFNADPTYCNLENYPHNETWNDTFKACFL